MEVLSIAEIDSCRSSCRNGARSIEDGYNGITKLIDAFQNEHVVETFAVSGNFGQKEIENLEKIKSILTKNIGELNNNLIPAIQKYLDEQERLNQTGK